METNETSYTTKSLEELQRIADDFLQRIDNTSKEELKRKLLSGDRV